MNTIDREKYIRSSLAEHYRESSDLGYEVMVTVVQGSQNYNLDIYTDEYKSDIDTKSIILPSFDAFCKNSQPVSHTHVRMNNEHIDLKDIRIMFDTFKKQNINFVEVLFSDWYIVNPKYEDAWASLRAIGEDLVHCHPAQTLRAMSGMCYEKSKALCHPYPSLKDKIEKYGYDGKQLHHIIRMNEFMKNYIAGMPFKDCLLATGDKLELMMAAKLNKFSLEEALKIADDCLSEATKLKTEYIEKYGDFCDGTSYKILEDIKLDVLKRWFKEQLLN